MYLVFNPIEEIVLNVDHVREIGVMPLVKADWLVLLHVDLAVT